MQLDKLTLKKGGYMERKPDITDEDVGIQAFKLRKEKAVERAMEKIRRSLSRSFLQFTQEDLQNLEWALGECWTMIGFHEWDNIAFSSLKPEEISKIISITRDIFKDRIKGKTGIEKIRSILTKKPQVNKKEE